MHEGWRGHARLRRTTAGPQGADAASELRLSSPTIVASQLELGGDGTPIDPLLVVDLDELADEDPEHLSRRAMELSRSLRVTVGLTTRAPTDDVLELAEALTCNLASDRYRGRLPRSFVPVSDVDLAAVQIREAVRENPQASVALAALLRQTPQLDAEAGLAAEAAVYSVLLGGREFQRWLRSRGAPRSAPSSGPSRVRVERSDGELTVILDRPERRNALDAELRERLYEALEVATLDPEIRHVVLRGEGPSFSSGGDLDEFGSATDVVAAYLVRLERAPWRLLDRIRERVEVRVHGAAIGAGAEIAAFAGRVSAAPDAFFRLPEVAMGLVPGAGGTVSIPRRIGRWRAAWLMLTGVRLDAASALEWGFVDRVGLET